MIIAAVVAIVLAGGAVLLWLGHRLSHVGMGTANPYLTQSLRYQPLALLTAVIAVGAVRLLVPEHGSYVAVGDMAAPASGLGVLGVSDGDSWLTVGLTFLVAMTVVTAVVMWFQVARSAGLTGANIGRALPWALALSAANALSEEILFRVTVAEGLGPLLPATIVALVSAVLFGVPHWFGSPGRIPGVLLAGFMGWFLTLSVLQTGGIGWAWTIHVVQDIVIITLLSARSATQNSPQPSQRMTAR